MTPAPVIEPFASGWLSTPDGHDVYWEQCGNPAGVPVLIVHGGPGSGCTAWMRSWFDADATMSVLFDQRNCGRSLPHASEPVVDLTTNTTPDLISDIERLREQVGVDAWVVAGISWGTTLALAYAEDHPTRVRGLLMVSMVTTSSAEVEWLTRGLAQRFPDAWNAFVEVLPEDRRDGSLAQAYAVLLADPDEAVRERAAQAWCAWEDGIVSASPAWQPNPRYSDPHFRLAFARIVTHYFAHAGFLPDGQLLARLPRLRDVPGVILEGAHDSSSPVWPAERVHDDWTASELWIDEDGGHGTSMVSIQRAARHLLMLL